MGRREVKSGGRILWVLGGVWLLVALVAIAWGVNSVEDDLAGRTRQALEAADFDEVGVAFAGRDARLLDPGLSAVERERVEAMLSDVDGIRDIRWAILEAVAVTTTASPTTVTETTTTTEATPPTTEPATTTTMATTVPVPASASLVASLDRGHLLLQGTLPEAQAQALDAVLALADLIYAPFVTNEVELDATLPAADWVPGAAHSIAMLPVVGTATLDIAGDTATLTGTTGAEANRAHIEDIVRADLGSGIEVDNRIEVTGKPPPIIDARTAADGTVVLSGVVPDEQAAGLIVGAAVEVFGAENVDNDISIDVGVEAKFSVFRVPLLFALFQPVPRWSFHIEDDVISANLGGGATFAFDSAELTPELEALSSAAAGILLRNGTLAMTIEGHTDSIGPDEYNKELSDARARNTAAFIQGLGVDPERLTAVGYGETRPLADNGNADGRDQNRRIEFVLGPPG